MQQANLVNFIRLFLFAIFLCINTLALKGQDKGIIQGVITNKFTNEPLPFVNVIIKGTTMGASSDNNGRYKLTDLKPGFYNIEFSYLGFKKEIATEIQVTNSRPAVVNMQLEEDASMLEGVTIEASAFTRKDESPVSLQTLGVAEIQRNPGGNRDISRAIQSLPGVASGVAFRNDIIIRGGAPNENRFYLDGVEVPNINHFATQGASGGPVGIINVDLIREVDFFSGAFPANRGNTLSSILEFKQKDPRTDKAAFRGIVGASDIGLIAEGPINERTSYLLSARRSYLQFLFNALGLPFLPTYNGFQAKVKHKFKNNDELYFVGLGSIDQFRLNTGLNLSLDPAINPGVDSTRVEEQQFILNQLPVNTQWSYTNGLVYKRFRKAGYQTFVLSRNMLNNRAFKYEGNDETNGRKILDYLSQEIENKFRFEQDIKTKSGYKINAGINLQYSKYNNRTYQLLAIQNQLDTIDFDSKLNLFTYGVFGNVSKGFFDEKLVLSAGFRADAANFSKSMQNPFEQFSPRLSMSYNFNERFSFNANTGIYYQMPAYTVLGFRDNAGILVNKANNVKYIQSNHLVAGFGYYSPKNFKATLEGFYKQYNNYPFLLREQISLANVGSDFGVVGNAPVSSTSSGRAYGVELLLQQKLNKKLYGIMSVTYVRSEFENQKGQLIPSAWDNRFLLALTGGYLFGKNWELGARYRLVGAAPNTPFDMALSARTDIWDVTQRGIPDFNQLNTVRFNNTSQLDIRIDKKWPFNKWALNLYFDIQNALNYQTNTLPNLTLERDSAGNPVLDPNNPGSYKLRSIANTAGTVLPTIGVIVDF